MKTGCCLCQSVYETTFQLFSDPSPRPTIEVRGVVARARGPTPTDVSEELGYRWGHGLEWLGRLSYAPGSETISATSYWYTGISTFIGKSPRILPGYLSAVGRLFSRRSPGFSFCALAPAAMAPAPR